MRCRLCGSDSPHGHTSQEQYLELYLRPAFEKMFAQKYAGNHSDSIMVFFPRVGSGWNRAPVGHGGTIPYPHYFGWYGQERFKNFGGADAYDDNHWAYRPSFGSAYRQEPVEFLWSMFQATADAVRELPAALPEELARRVVIQGETYESVELAARQLGITVLMVLVRIADPNLREYNYA